jgi:hypothetical protein
VARFYCVHAKPLPTVRRVHLAEAVEEHRRRREEGAGSWSRPPLSRTTGEA